LEQDPRLPDSPLYARHIATCSLCRGALAALAAQTLPAPLALAALQDHPLDDLPAFIDLAIENTAAAVRAYPVVWWHLWTCSECAETYFLTRAFLEEEERQRRPVAASVPAIARPLRREQVRLSRAFLNSALLTPPASWGVMRGGESQGAMLVEEQNDAGRTLRLTVIQEPDGPWRVTIETIPPATGEVVLKLGSVVRQAHFAPDGSATLGMIDGAIFLAEEGPDLVVELEAADDRSTGASS
jgi:hypothetical protein